MKLEQKVCSLELSKKLKELGIRQDSTFSWAKNVDGNFYAESKEWKLIFNEDAGVSYTDSFSAFLSCELGEMLRPHLNLIKEYIPSGVENKALFFDFLSPLPNIKTLAKILIYLLESNIINQKDL